MSQYNQQIQVQLKLNRAMRILQDVQQMMNVSSNLSITVNKPPLITSFKRRFSDICDTSTDLDDTENSCVALSTPNRSLQALANRNTPSNTKVARIEGSNCVPSTSSPVFTITNQRLRPQQIWLNARPFDRTPKGAQILLIDGKHLIVVEFHFNDSSMSLAEILEPTSYRTLMNGSVVTVVTLLKNPRFRFNAVFRIDDRPDTVDNDEMLRIIQETDTKLSIEEKDDLAKKMSNVSVVPDDAENLCVTLSTPNRLLPAMQPLANRITPSNPKTARIEGSDRVPSTPSPIFKSPKSSEGSEPVEFTVFKDKKPQEIWLNARVFDLGPKKSQLLLIKGNQTCLLYFQFKNSTMNLAEIFEPSSYRNLKMNGTVLTFVSPKNLPTFRFNAIVKLGPSTANDLATMWDKAKKIDTILSQKEKAVTAKKPSPSSTGQATPVKVLAHAPVQQSNTTIDRRTPLQTVTIVKKKKPQEIGEKSTSPSIPVSTMQKSEEVMRSFTSRSSTPSMQADNLQKIVAKKEEMD